MFGEPVSLREAREVVLKRLSTWSATSPLLRSNAESAEDDFDLHDLEKVENTSKSSLGRSKSQWYRHGWRLAHILLLATYTSFFAMVLLQANRTASCAHRTEYNGLLGKVDLLNCEST